ncbi:uncharacterized protein LOC135209844 [Macrobrachium nipponense]|uniref:uncharacterized protein LOC135209844 n=1 Tax=Macrobrachium nipponense TaxID=159736 RepID=UPI0030C7C343
MALSDAKCKFLFVDVGAEGGAGDGGTRQRCNLAMAITNNRAGLPQDRNLPNNDEPISFHICADNAFALNTWFMKPYSHQSQDPTERICSYRLSRTRLVVENTFGLLQMRWGPNYTRRAKAVRDYLAQYYSSDAGTVEWQERMVFPRGRPATDE